jgi:predicted porin
MQMKIIAIVVAGLVSGAAFAQGAPGGAPRTGAPAGPGASASSITLYGQITMQYLYMKSDYRKFSGVETGMATGGSYTHIGFRGEEALGDGLKAVYQLEWGVDADEGGGPGQGTLGARYAWAGLQGSFGKVYAGRIAAPTEFYMGGTSPFFINGYKPTGTFRTKTRILGDLRWSNSIAYDTPNWSGFSGQIQYSFGEKVATADDCGAVKCADTADAGKLGIGVRYANGPLYLAAIYQQIADDDSLKASNGSNITGFGAKGWALGGAYDFKVVKLYANYWREKANHGGAASNNPTTKGSDKVSFWSVGATIPVSSAGTIFAEYAQYKDYLYGGMGSAPIHSAWNGSPARLAGATSAGTSKGFQLGYRHNLSRRTSLFASAQQIKSAKGFTGAGKPGQNQWAGVAGKNQEIYTAGIIHSF